MKTWAWAAVCLTIVGAASMGGAAGCSSDDPKGDGDGNEGGSGATSGNGGNGSGNNGPGPASGSGNPGPASGPASTGAGPGPGAGGGAAESCDDIGVCDGAASCLECTVIGDPASYEDAGTCEGVYTDCFGTMEDCSDGNADCCAFNECVANCPADDPATAAVNENLECLCTSANGMQCDATSMPGTCAGDHEEGFNTYIPFVQCVLGACATSCQ